MPNSTLPIRNTAIPTTDPEAGLKITEIFYSLQGEALTAGLPTIFIRLTGCPLRCVYCDTEYAFVGGEVSWRGNAMKISTDGANKLNDAAAPAQAGRDGR